MILTLTIPEDLSSAELASQIIYGDETPLSRTETSPYITLPESEEIFQRNIEKEEALFNQIPVEKLETIAQVIPQSHSLKFHLHNTSEEHTQRFFQVIDDMIQQ
ncbi:MAG: hypothetical protein U9Q15_01255 [Patescibacteria group bacterium]|nr:hypothetical protein [Patescibacteria group bacterium]